MVADYSNLRITEVMYAHPNGNDYEYIEFKNIGSTPLDLAGVRITNGVAFTFPPAPHNTILAAGAYTCVVSNLTKFQNRYGTGPSVAGVYTGHLANLNDNITVSLPAPTMPPS